MDVRTDKKVGELIIYKVEFDPKLEWALNTCLAARQFNLFPSQTEELSRFTKTEESEIGTFALTYPGWDIPDGLQLPYVMVGTEGG